MDNEILADEATLYLRNYLGPRGRYPYNQLFSDMETHLAAGRKVYVISVPGFMMAAGYPDMKIRPWHDMKDRYYKTAKDCIDRKNGRK